MVVHFPRLFPLRVTTIFVALFCTILVVCFPRLYQLRVTTAVSASVICECMVSRAVTVCSSRMISPNHHFHFSKSRRMPRAPISPNHRRHCSSNSIKPSRLKMTGGLSSNMNVTENKGGGTGRKRGKGCWARWRRWRWSRIRKGGKKPRCSMFRSFTS